jgi:DNA excision repair protein ERCC-2
MAVVMAKKFLRTMAQPFDHSQLGISLWNKDMVEDMAKKDRKRAPRSSTHELNNRMEL